MKRKTIKQLEDQAKAEIEFLKTDAIALRKSHEAIRIERDKALQSEKKTREQFDDLKQRLLSLETDNARLNGYVARVHEDDIVRDGMIEIEDQNGKRLIPKRPNPLTPNSFTQYEQFSAPNYLPYGNEKKTHWTSY